MTMIDRFVVNFDNQRIKDVRPGHPRKADYQHPLFTVFMFR